MQIQGQPKYFRTVPDALGGIVIHHQIMPNPGYPMSREDARQGIADCEAGRLLLPHRPRLSIVSGDYGA